MRCGVELAVLVTALVLGAGCSLFLGDTGEAPDVECVFGDNSTCESGVCAVDGSCVECTAHAHCDSLVCDRDTGDCVAEAEVLYVDAENVAATVTCGSKTDPCENAPVGLTRAIDTERRFIRVDGTMFSAVVVDRSAPGGQPFVFVGPEATYATNDGELIAIDGGNAVFDGFTIVGTEQSSASTSPGIGCNGGTLVVRDVVVQEFPGLGIEARDCDVIIRETSVRLNRAGVLIDSPGTFQVVNNAITENGPGGGFAGIMIAEANGVGRLDHNTIADNELGANGFGVRCEGVDLTGFNNTITSVGESGTGVIGDCSWEHSNIQTSDGLPLPGDGNLSEDPVFEFGAQSYRLDPTSPLIDAGLEIPGLRIDRDGQPRVRGNAPDIGAFEAAPP